MMLKWHWERHPVKGFVLRERSAVILCDSVRRLLIFFSVGDVLSGVQDEAEHLHEQTRASPLARANSPERTCVRKRTRER